MNNLRILHLTDLHFNKDEKLSQKEDRENVLKNLIQKLGGKKEFNNLDFIIISGDIAWTGSEDDYFKAETFIKELKSDLLLDDDFIKNRLIICPGNHDVIQDEAKEKYIEFSKGNPFPLLWDKLNFNDEGAYIKRWSDKVFPYFTKFCEKIKINPYENKTKKQLHTCGTRIFYDQKVCIMVLNSSWFCLGEWKAEKGGKNFISGDYGKLFIGQKLIWSLKTKIKEDLKSNYNDFFKIVVLHHPPGWLSWEEKFNNSSNNYIPSLDLINDFADIVFCGHEHGEIKDPVVYGNNALWIIGGASYSRGENGKSYRNNLSLVEIKKQDGLLSRKPYDYIPGKGKWKIDSENRFFLLGSVINHLQTLCVSNFNKYQQIINSINQSKSNFLDSLSVKKMERVGICKKIIEYIFHETEIKRVQEYKNKLLFKLKDKDVYIEMTLLKKMGKNGNFNSYSIAKPESDQYILFCYSILAIKDPWHPNEYEFKKDFEKVIKSIEERYQNEILSRKFKILTKLFEEKDVRDIIKD